MSFLLSAPKSLFAVAFSLIAGLLMVGCDGLLVSYGEPPKVAANTQKTDAGIEGSVALYGDRNLGTEVVYPDAALFQNGGPVINLRNPPAGIRAASGDGVHDDTASFQDAYDFIKANFVSGASRRGYWMYLPHGTYLVSDTLIYRGDSLEAPTGYDWYDIVAVRWVGESRDGTVIRLADAAPGFQDPANPKILMAYQHPSTRFNNIAAQNLLERITLDTGTGNPGAIGLLFQGANSTSMNDVRVRSADGTGVYGIWFPIGSLQGAFHDITVEGFGYGIDQPANAECDVSLEHVTLRGQRIAGARLSGGGMTLRAASIEETVVSVPALVLDGSGGQLVVVDSHLQNVNGSTAVQLLGNGQKQLFVRNTQVDGFMRSIVNGAFQLTGDVKEYLSSTPVRLFPDQPTSSFSLPVLDSPLVPWFSPEDWANVDDYRRAGAADDTSAIQSAMNSGKPVVYFPSAHYSSGPISVPATVRRIEGFEVTDLQFSVAQAAAEPLLIRDLNGYGGVHLNGDRSLVIQDSSASFENDGQFPQHIFLENDTNIGASPHFTVAGQRTFGRGLDDENTGGLGDFYAAGGALWILNFKTENKPVSTLYAASGSMVEVLGGYTNITLDPGATPFVVNDGASVSYVGFTHLSCFQTQVAISESRNHTTHSVAPGALPDRGIGNGCYTIPLYVGYDAATLAAGLAALR